MNIPWGRMLIFSACIYLLFVLLAWAYGNKVMFPVPQPSYSESENINFVTTSSGNKIALTRHGKKQNLVTALFTVMETVETLAAQFSTVGKIKTKFIAYDYPGYGLSTEPIGGRHMRQLIHHQYLTGELGRSPEKIIIWADHLVQVLLLPCSQKRGCWTDS